MEWNLIYTLLLALLLGCLVLLLKCRLHAAEPGENTALSVVVDANNDAPELETLLKDLLWLRNNQFLRAEITVRDLGLTAEAKALAQTFCRSEHIRFVERE